MRSAGLAGATLTGVDLREALFDAPAPSAPGWREISGLLDRYPRGSLVILDRAGHLLFAEQVDLFRHLAGEWLDRAAEHVAADSDGGSKEKSPRSPVDLP